MLGKIIGETVRCSLQVWGNFRGTSGALWANFMMSGEWLSCKVCSKNCNHRQEKSNKTKVGIISCIMSEIYRVPITKRT